MLSDLRESGAIEQDADIVMFIHNPSRYGDLQVEDGPNICELIVAKHRNGSLAKIKLKWIPEITTFVDVGVKSNVEVNHPTPPPPSAAEQEIVMQETDNLDEIDF